MKNDKGSLNMVKYVGLLTLHQLVVTIGQERHIIGITMFYAGLSPLVSQLSTIDITSKSPLVKIQKQSVFIYLKIELY